jgi:DNA-binding PadR family transcriptional regulator
MERINLGELEELVLLTIGVLDRNAYGVSVKKEIFNQIGRNVNISAVHSVLMRLEKKGMIKSTVGGATDQRGGRRKRFFYLTMAGKSALEFAYQTRNQLYEKIPQMQLKYNFE